MIKINDKEYNLENFNCHWGKFTKTYHSIQKIGIAPRLHFIVDKGDDSKELFLELTITDDEFKDMPLGKEMDMYKEIVDMGYANKQGWLTLSNSNYMFIVTKLDMNKFLIKFKYEDFFENLFFEIDEKIMLDYFL